MEKCLELFEFNFQSVFVCVCMTFRMFNILFIKIWTFESSVLCIKRDEEAENKQSMFNIFAICSEAGKMLCNFMVKNELIFRR